MPNSALVTGGAGFIGSHVVDRLLAEGWCVTTLDNFDRFYDPALKRANVGPHRDYDSFRLIEGDIRDEETLRMLPDVDVIVHLAARAGVRPSIADPLLYQDVNVLGTHRMLEFARERRIRQFVFASSSSVYGVNPNVPWREDDHVLQPISPYASTKVSGELLGHVYSRLFDIRFLALRFFTVFGPRQRPDLAIRKFAQRMMRGESIPFFGDGSARRDFTFVDDTTAGIVAAMQYERSMFEVINLGNNRAVSLTEMVAELERVLDVPATLDRQPDQPGDVPQTWANIEKAERLLGYSPSTPFAHGLERFAAWLTGVRAPRRAPAMHPVPAAPAAVQAAIAQ